MQGRYLPSIVTLIAGLIASIICLLKRMSIIRSLSTVLITLIIFLILGVIARKVIVLTLTEKQEVSEKKLPEDSEEEAFDNDPEHENDTKES